MKCPKCIGKLDEITIELDEVTDPKESKHGKIKKKEIKLKLDQCFVCNGVWFDKGELEKYLEKSFTIVDSPPIDSELRDRLDEKVGKCPRCNVDMIKCKAPKNPSITIDSCPDCSGIWLDNTEIDKLEQGKLNLIEKVKLKIRQIF